MPHTQRCELKFIKYPQNVEMHCANAECATCSACASKAAAHSVKMAANWKWPWESTDEPEAAPPQQPPGPENGGSNTGKAALCNSWCENAYPNKLQQVCK